MMRSMESYDGRKNFNFGLQFFVGLNSAGSSKQAKQTNNNDNDDNGGRDAAPSTISKQNLTRFAMVDEPHCAWYKVSKNKQKSKEGKRAPPPPRSRLRHKGGSRGG